MDLTKCASCREGSMPCLITACASRDRVAASADDAFAKQSSASRVRGYAVTVTWKTISPKEAAEKRSAIARVLARNLPK